MPGLKLSDEDREKIDAKFLCSLCSLLLIQPVQTLCGHLFCSSCVENLLKISPAHCPVDGSEVNKDKTFPDNFTRREILDLNIHCPNGCKWVGTVKEYQEHPNVCDESLICCVHNQCKQEIKRCLLAQHLKEDCLYRQEKCPYCRQELQFALLKDHCDRDCSAFPVTCKHCEKANIPRGNLKEHESVECEDFKTSCDFKIIGCTHVEGIKKKQLREHLSVAVINHVQLLLTFVLGSAEKIQSLIPKLDILNVVHSAIAELKHITGMLSSEINALAKKFASLLQTVTGLERRVENLESSSTKSKMDSKFENRISEINKTLEIVVEKNRRTENELREKVLLIERLRTQLDQVDHSMALTTVKLSDMEFSKENQPVQMGSCNGTLIWRIDSVKRKRQDAVKGVQTAMYSPPFYSGQYGYKMCARIYLNGDGFGKDTHISLFFVVMKGEYDALLPWPFQKKITMMLMDQNNGNHMIDAFRSDPQSSSFQRPKSDMNIASGSPLFIPLDGLANHGFVKDDNMFIKIMVD